MTASTIERNARANRMNVSRTLDPALEPCVLAS
jgi:hypothetical protein